ncbi:UvrD-helicase domain-containing protein [Vibrio sp. ED002]|uniref:UvrD-helicase domain-containing protein n=1 Tax=Vibrio sp. ED002 TaxID=2785123 RepID=UPI00200EA358|nr:UvrD-helicase domain-containing protein [Vibrio sp. ED002]UQA50780.1 UvrD-helicase domain-containing protein [Vibrio sp. ED002]
MELSIENLEKLEDEKNCQNIIERKIDSMSDFVFEAGAGSGKTYALKESIKYILVTKSKQLNRNNKKVLCITYTNSASSELKSRLGNTKLVEISTIHDALWGIVCNQKKALRNVHRSKINREIDITERDFLESDNGKVNSWFKSQNDIFIRKEFIQKILSKDFLDLYFSRKRRKKLKEFKDEVESFGYTFNKNQGKFEKTVYYVNKISKLIRAKDKLDTENNILVKYDPNTNRDALHKMKFSHDTLLEHSLSICNEYPSMLDIIIDKYPYIFVDEFQDTSPTVISLLSKISTRAKERARDMCVGYFGDPMQAIYRKGIGSKVHCVHNGLCTINKRHNRRSFKEVIEVFDKFRTDDLSQFSIYDDCEGGSFEYYYCKLDSGDKTSDLVKVFLPEIKDKLELGEDDKICCLVLKNSTISELVGFPDLYRSFSRLFYHEDASRLIISNNVNNLDQFIRRVYNIINFLYKSEAKNKSLRYFTENTSRNITLKESLNYIKEVRSIKLDRDVSLSEVINDVLSSYSSYSRLLQENIQDLFFICNGEYNLDQFINNSVKEVSEYLFKDIDEVNDIITEALGLKLDEFIKWYEYLDKDIKSNEVFMTCHNSKGLEYKNVVVFLEERFERKSDYISAFFDDIDNEKYQSRRNLLYVSLSRAVKNLIVCYLCNDEESASKPRPYFGEPKKWVLGSRLSNS